MKKSILITLLFSLNLAIEGAAQNVDLITGNLDFLKGILSIGVEFRYTETAVGEYKLESEYISAKVNELNEKKSGKGDKWLAQWNEEKIRLNEPNFIKYLNKELSKVKIVAKKGSPKSKYSMVVETKFIEKGWDTYLTIVSSASEVSLVVMFYEGADREKEVAKVSIQAAGSGGAIYSAYAGAGKGLGKFIRKAIKEK